MEKASDNTLDKFLSLRDKGLQGLLDGRKQGLRVIGAYCAYCPQELIIAAGAIPISLCGTREEPIPAAEEKLPRNLCPLIKSSYGFAITDSCPYFTMSELIVAETTCDGKKKMYELLERKKPVHLMQLPNVQDGAAPLKLWAAEIQKLRERLETQLRVTITDEAIWEAIDLVNAERRALKAVHDLNQSNPPLLPGLDLLTASWAVKFARDKHPIIRLAHELVAEKLAQEPQPRSTKPRILLTGCPVGLGSEKVVRLLDELGADMVAMENCSGYKTLDIMTATDHTDPIMALAEKYLQIPCSCMSPNPHRLELLTQMLEDFRIDAVIDLTWQACHTYNIEAYDVGRLVTAAGLPFLHLESDYSVSDLESLKVRIEALLEMVG